MSSAQGNEHSLTKSSRYQLHVQLSPEWSVIDLAVVNSALQSIEATAVDVSWRAVGLLLSVERLKPDLVAVLSLPLTGKDGEVEGLLLASLISITVPAHDIPAIDDPTFELQVVDDVTIDDGHRIAFVVQTIPVVSEDGEMVTLLTFSSPNVPLLKLLEAGYSAIASGSRLVPLTTSPR
jgi:hypothetical protein